jgi:hypothetical protein
MTNLSLLLFSLFVFLSFTLFVVLKYGIQTSISASIGVLTGAIEKSFYSWFILGIAIPVGIVADNWMGFWAMAMLSLDFAAWAVKNDKQQMLIHCFGADAGIALGITMLGAIFQQWWLVLIALWGAAVLKMLTKWYKKDTFTWWVECWAYFIILVGLIVEKVL